MHELALPAPCAALKYMYAIHVLDAIRTLAMYMSVYAYVHTVCTLNTNTNFEYIYVCIM